MKMSYFCIKNLFYKHICRSEQLLFKNHKLEAFKMLKTLVKWL